VKVSRGVAARRAGLAIIDVLGFAFGFLLAANFAVLAFQLETTGFRVASAVLALVLLAVLIDMARRRLRR
jgi:uncharacterized membrane protein